MPEAATTLNLNNAAECARQYIETIEPYPRDFFRGRGIVTCAGGMKYYTAAWVLIKTLRMFGCQLPIQVWYLGEEEQDEEWIELVEPLGEGENGTGPILIDWIRRGFAYVYFIGPVPFLSSGYYEVDLDVVWDTVQHNLIPLLTVLEQIVPDK